MDVTADPTSNSSFPPPPVPVVGKDRPANFSPQAAGLRTKLLERIVELTQPARLPQEWDFLGATKSMRRLGGEPSDLIASLRTDFSLAELLATRIVDVGTDNQPRLSPIFGDTSSSFVILRDAMRSASDVISARGLLSSPAPDWLRLAAERADGSTRHEQPVLLAFSDPEALVLHRLGCHFTSAAGLEHLRGQQVRELFAARAKRRELRKYTLTLAGWQIAECADQPPPSTLGALAQISQIQTVFGCDPAAVFAAWLPTPAEFSAILTARSFADRKAVCKTFSHSLHHSRFSPAAAHSVIRDRAAIDYGTARDNLIREIEGSGLVPRCGEVADAYAQLHKSFQTSVVAKFLDSCAASSDPWEKLRLILGADLAQCWWNTLDVVNAAQKIIAGEFPDRCDSAQRLDQKLRAVDTFAKLYKLRLPR